MKNTIFISLSQLTSKNPNTSLPTTQLSTKAIPKSTTKSVYRTSNDEHHL